MKANYNRRKFMGGVTKSAAGLLILPSIAFIDTPEPAIDGKIVNEFVRIAHSDFGKVKEMLGQYPHLLNASWDWGDGDFETAIGAAGHMGLKDIANYLIEQGARYDIFVMTMLGKTSIVKAMLDEHPLLLNSYGPHGLTLLHHAKKGGDDNMELVNYIQSKGLMDTFKKTFKKQRY